MNFSRLNISFKKGRHGLVIEAKQGLVLSLHGLIEIIKLLLGTAEVLLLAIFQDETLIILVLLNLAIVTLVVSILAVNHSHVYVLERFLDAVVNVIVVQYGEMHITKVL